MVSDHVVAYERIAGPAYPSRLAIWSRRLALFCLSLVVLDVLLHRLFSLPTPVAFNIFAAGMDRRRPCAAPGVSSASSSSGARAAAVAAVWLSPWPPP